MDRHARIKFRKLFHGWIHINEIHAGGKSIINARQLPAGDKEQLPIPRRQATPGELSKPARD